MERLVKKAGGNFIWMLCVPQALITHSLVHNEQCSWNNTTSD